MDKQARWQWLDLVRGLAVLGMLLYHTMYDYNVVLGHNDAWDFQNHIHLWQQSLVYAFIMIAGISCSRLDIRKKCKQALKLNVVGLGITLGTSYFMPSQAIFYGVITFVGCAYGLDALRQYVCPRWPQNKVGLGSILLLLWLFTFDIRTGSYGWVGVEFWQWPKELYHPGLALLGLAPPPFYSADYVPLLPHFFIFELGVLLGSYLEAKEYCQDIEPLNYLGGLGRHSLLVYLIHQPILLGVMNMFLAGN